MESFMKAADDLDKLLDDFEKNEDTVLKGKTSFNTRPREVSPSRPIQNGVEQSYELLRDKDPSEVIQPDGGGSSSDSDLLIDLSEADFAPAPQSATLLASLKSETAPSFTLNNFSQPSMLDDFPAGELMGKADSNTHLSGSDISSYMQTNLDNSVNLSQVGDFPGVQQKDNKVHSDHSFLPVREALDHANSWPVTNGGLEHTDKSSMLSIEERGSDTFDKLFEGSSVTHDGNFQFRTQVDALVMNGSLQTKNQEQREPAFNTLNTDFKHMEAEQPLPPAHTIPHHEMPSSAQIVMNSTPEIVPSNSYSQSNVLINGSDSLTNGSDSLTNASDSLTSDNGSLPNGTNSSTNFVEELASQENKVVAKSEASVKETETKEEKSLDPKLMETYLRQGARPKILTRTPDHSPQRVDSEMTNGLPPVEPVQTNTMSDIVMAPPKSRVVGFGDTSSISVTEADLEALESDFDLEKQNQTQPFLASTVPAPNVGCKVDARSDQQEKSINVPPLDQSKPAMDNELAKLDPFYQEKTNVENDTSNQRSELHSNMSQENPLKDEGHRLKTNAMNNQSANMSEVHQRGNYIGGDKPVENIPQIRNNLWQEPNQNTNMPTLGSHPPGTYMPVLDPFSPHQVQRGPVSSGTHTVQPQMQGQVLNAPSSQFSPQNFPQSQNGLVHPQPQNSQTHHPTPHQFGFPAQMQQGPNSLLPPDPPSYEQVEEWKNSEANRNSALSRGGLHLNFNEHSHRRSNAMPLPPSPILEEVGIAVTGPQEHSMPPPSSQHSPEPQRTAAQDAAVIHPQDGHSPRPTVPPNRVPQTNGEVPGESLTMEIGGEVVRLGEVAPLWIPDEEAPSCMKCGLKFTFRKRRHHCRACGKIFCSKCCNVRIKLKYMKSREARVCSNCLNAILTAQAMRRMNDAISNSDNSTDGSQTENAATTENSENGEITNPDGVQDPSLQRNKSVLRRPSTDGTQKPRESRKVHFSDGIPAGSDEANTHHSSSNDSVTRNQRKRLSRQKNGKSFIPENEESLPPRLIPSGATGDFRTDENPNMEEVMQVIRDEYADPVVFILAKNLQVIVKIMQLTCCVNRTCWCFTTKGLAAVGQDEIVFVLECLPAESIVPRDLFLHIYHIYQAASKGSTLQHLSHSLFTHSFLGSRDHGGFLYLQPTYQCQRKLILPEQPYLYAVLLQKWELPWAKVFPLRLLLRLGAEFRYYPCPLMSVRHRKPVFGEIGHTIMNLLADFKNYQYMLPLIRGVVVHMQDHETIVQLPRNRYDDVMKVINNSNEHVMAIGANFSPAADSHLVCIQKEDGTYQTQAINRQNKPRKVTGASFLVLNGALKSSSGLTAKSSIVEDGLMIQIRPEMMVSLRQALREMEDFRIPCGAADAPNPEETVSLTWIEDDTAFNIGVSSPVDGKPLEGIESIRIQNTTDFQGQEKLIRWTEVFFLENGGGDSRTKKHVPEPVDLSRLAESLAIAFCLALSDSLRELTQLGLTKLGLRVTVDVEKVGYEVGSRGHSLPDQYMNNLDDLLIPVLHNAVTQQEGGPIIMELIFHIID